MEFLATNEGDVLSNSAVQSVYWSPPPLGLYKVNVDAATFKDIRATRIGVVIRDSLGKVAAVLCRKLEASLGPLEAESKALEAESKALEAGILFAQCRGCSAVVLEGDSQVLVNALVGSSPFPLNCGFCYSGGSRAMYGVLTNSVLSCKEAREYACSLSSKKCLQHC